MEGENYGAQVKINSMMHWAGVEMSLGKVSGLAYVLYELWIEFCHPTPPLLLPDKAGRVWDSRELIQLCHYLGSFIPSIFIKFEADIVWDPGDIIVKTDKDMVAAEY